MNMIPRDINCTTEAEFYVTSSCMFVGLLLNAFIIGSMASALNAMDFKKQICRGKLETIGLYLHVNEINPGLRSRILEYYEYLYTSSQVQPSPTPLLSSPLPHHHHQLHLTSTSPSLTFPHFSMPASTPPLSHSLTST